MSSRLANIVNASLVDVLTVALIGVAGWFITEFWFGLFRERRRVQRAEWEYRLKEIYCPLYFWTGLLLFERHGRLSDQLYERLHEIMAKAAYVIPRGHYHTIIRLLEVAHDQATSGVSREQRDDMREYLYSRIEVLNFILYRSDDTGGVGDPIIILASRSRVIRIALMALRHILAWAIVVFILGGSIWLYFARHFLLLAVAGMALLVIVWVDLRSHTKLQRGIEVRLKL